MKKLLIAFKLKEINHEEDCYYVIAFLGSHARVCLW